MKLDAHPLVVAVALGLLGPGALASEDDDEAPAAACGRPPCNEAGDPPGDDAGDGAPDTDEIARAELEWAKLH